MTRARKTLSKHRLSRRRYLGASGLCLLGMMLPTTLNAAPISLKEANQIAEQETGGRVVRADSATLRGKAVYRVRVVHHGRIQDLVIDANSGKLIDPLKGDNNNENSGGRR